MPKGLRPNYRIRSFLSNRHAHGDLCKHLEIDSSTDLDKVQDVYFSLHTVNSSGAKKLFNQVYFGKQ